jgi:hypothetical protein
VIIDVQPVAFFPLLTRLARLVRVIEKQMLWTLLAIQVSQQHYPGIGERLDDTLPHDRLPQPDVDGDIAVHCISTN